MQIENAHITWKCGTTEFKHCSASINVPGLGNVEIKDFISDGLRSRIESEAIFALNQRLGITCANVKLENNEVSYIGGIIKDGCPDADHKG